MTDTELLVEKFESLCELLDGQSFTPETLLELNTLASDITELVENDVEFPDDLFAGKPKSIQYTALCGMLVTVMEVLKASEATFDNLIIANIDANLKQN